MDSLLAADDYKEARDYLKLHFMNEPDDSSIRSEVCKISRELRTKICKEKFDNAPDKGFCASQDLYFYGYKVQGACSVNGVFHAGEMKKASLHGFFLALFKIWFLRFR